MSKVWAVGMGITVFSICVDGEARWAIFWLGVATQFVGLFWDD